MVHGLSAVAGLLATQTVFTIPEARTVEASAIARATASPGVPQVDSSAGYPAGFRPAAPPTCPRAPPQRVTSLGHAAAAQ